MAGRTLPRRKATFAEKTVRPELDRFVLLKLDATNDDDPKVIDVQKRYKVVRLPTVILIGADGQEVKRFTDFVPPSEFLPALRSAKWVCVRVPHDRRPGRLKVKKALDGLSSAAPV